MKPQVSNEDSSQPSKELSAVVKGLTFISACLIGFVSDTLNAY